MPVDPLSPYGWDDRLEATLRDHAGEGAEPARVTTVHRGECDVVTRRGLERVASPPGVGTGDWVTVADGRIHAATQTVQPDPVPTSGGDDE